jgi:phosphatidylserine/phosphatidylglycerophosphate/cardiolipin synthase-like enzyme
MQVFRSVEREGEVLVSARAYKGDAMTLLAFDLHPSMLENFVGFSIRVKQGNRRPYYLSNRLSFSPSVLKKNGIDKIKKLSTEYSPIQKFRWVHLPSSEHYVANPFFGEYTYEITPRYMRDKILQKLDPSLTVSLPIEVSPFHGEEIQVGFTRAFVSSQAYAYYFNNNTKMRPNTVDLIFDIKKNSGIARRKNPFTGKIREVPYTFEDQHEYLGWQVRDRIMEFLDEALADNTLKLDVFAYDLDEPVIVHKLISLAEQGRLHIILDDSSEHTKAEAFETKFESLFQEKAKEGSMIHRGRFHALAHSKIFIQRRLGEGGKAVKLLTGSTNFTTGGMYINANHVLVFNNPDVAQLYADMFDLCLGTMEMKAFKNTEMARKDHVITITSLPDMTLRFSPHLKDVTDVFFAIINKRIRDAKSDVLFAIMDDDSESSILDAVREQVRSDKVFTYGITDNTTDTYLYKPNSKRGVKVAGKGTETALPPPFDQVAKIPGHNIHHKFVIVDFKGKDGVVYCGSSNLAYKPEQRNGDNLIEIRNEDVVTAFAVEGIRLVDHFHWRNKKATAQQNQQPLYLNDSSDPQKVWHRNYYNPDDLLFLERTLLINDNATS